MIITAAAIFFVILAGTFALFHFSTDASLVGDTFAHRNRTRALVRKNRKYLAARRARRNRR